MKQLLLILIALPLPFGINAQALKPLNVKPISASNYGPSGFWGLKFGESFEEAINHAKAKVFEAEIHSQTLKGNTKMASINDVRFAGNQCNIILLFYKDKLINGSAIISVDHCVDSEAKYEEIKNDILKKYGKTRSEEERYYPPYEKGDGYFATGIQMGKIKIGSTWGFYSNSKLTKAIKLEINDDCSIRLAYFDMILGKEWQERTTENNMNDY